MRSATQRTQVTPFCVALISGARTIVLALFPLTLACTSATAGGIAPYHYDARLGAATREERAGWVCLHLMGTPWQVGFRHGYLLANEIDDANKALRLFLKHDSGKDWSFFRAAARKMFWANLDPEIKVELTGMADGLRARGAKYDVIDMLAHNSWFDLDWYYLPALEAKLHKTALVSRAPDACSAFIATGSETRDGKIVMGHNSWIQYILGERWRVILDIKPQRGYRMLMDAFPGFLHSGSDFCINSAGLMIEETTIGGFKGFDESAIPEFVRARRTEQYARNLNDFVRIMCKGNNGGYANAWLIGDSNTNEIGKLELGLKNVMYCSATDGAYYGCNLPENPNMIAEECDADSVNAPMCTHRKARWLELLATNKGKVDAELGKKFLADTYDPVAMKHGPTHSTLCAHGDLDTEPKLEGAVNARVTTSSLTKKMQLWARIGFPDGGSFTVAPYIAKHHEDAWQTPVLHDIVPHPWALFSAR